MGISLRDESGQAFIEYILVLIVAVAIILGGIYQLNSAFKVWANNYFGDYLACLLETGELPAISGTGGDAGVCNQAFKPFSLADGRPLRSGAAQAPEPSAGGTGGGTRERPTSRSGGGQTFIARSSGPAFSRGQQRSNQSGKGKGGAKSGATYTGNTSASGYDQFGGSRRPDPPRQTRLDTKFAFDDQKEKLKRRTVSSIKGPKPAEVGGRKAGIKLRQRIARKDALEDTSGSGFTFAVFLRYLIIAAIIIAILVFLGGQGLQIGKSMDRG